MHKILSFYEFNTFDFLDIKENQKILLNNCKRLGIKGTIILAEEGINGTICGTEISIEEITSIIYKLNFNPNIKTSISKSNAFKRLKVKIQPEIVTFDGLGKFASNTGEFIDPEDWDNFIKNKDVEIIDVRNFYETVIGKFPNSKDPNTERFTDFIEFVEKELVKVKNYFYVGRLFFNNI